MTKEQLRAEVARLMSADSKQAVHDMMSILQECLFKIFMNHPKAQGDSNSTVDAKIVIQMMFSRICNLKKDFEGFGYKANNGDELNKLIDPTIIASSVRTVFETVGMFSTIYVKTDSDEEKFILYNLWVIAGLKYRQRFVTANSSAENVQKAAEEKKSIDDAIAAIEATGRFKALSIMNKDKIYKCIEKYDFTIRFDGSNIKHLNGYQDMVEKAGVRSDIMGNIYTFFSLCSHPSNVAVFQFANMFSIEDPQFVFMSTISLKLAFMLTSVFIADYIKTFPEVLPIFNSLDVRDQCIINCYNIFARDRSYSINDEYNKLDD